MEHRLVTPDGVPPGAPLLVALHGCTQNAPDFAAGTRFDEVAARYGASVLYPEQSQRANPQRCWNWFLPQHQRRNAGEPAQLIDLVERTAQQLGADRTRIFVAGLSAGAAMAAILAEQAPDIFAAAGLMSGVALHQAQDADGAYVAMRGLGSVAASNGVPLPASSYRRLRVTVWSGERDTTVAAVNGALLAAQFRTLLGTNPEPLTEREDGATIERWRDDTGAVRLEHWNVDALPHGWSGGSAAGSFTFPEGPDASEKMMRFFLAA